MTWVTEISHVNELFYFIDNQKMRSYKYWHHQHFFQETNREVKLDEIINYAAPYGLFGKLLESIRLKKSE